MFNRKPKSIAKIRRDYYWELYRVDKRHQGKDALDLSAEANEWLEIYNGPALGLPSYSTISFEIY